MEYLVICNNTNNHINMLLLLQMLKLSLWWQQYNDNANGWYLLTKLLPSSYISTFLLHCQSICSQLKKMPLFWVTIYLLCIGHYDHNPHPQDHICGLSCSTLKNFTRHCMEAKWSSSLGATSNEKIPKISTSGQNFLD